MHSSVSFVFFMCVCVHSGIYMFFKKDERRKEERSKQGQTNNKAKKQHSTPKAVTFPKKNELFASGGT